MGLFRIDSIAKTTSLIFESGRSENGSRTKTTEPTVGVAMLHLPPDGSSLPPKMTRSKTTNIEIHLFRVHHLKT
jgi:hypothetical protein